MCNERRWENFSCDEALACGAINDGICFLATHIEAQSSYDQGTSGGWTKESWLQFVERVRDFVQYCPFREKVVEVVITNQPFFVDASDPRY